MGTREIVADFADEVARYTKDVDEIVEAKRVRSALKSIDSAFVGDELTVGNLTIKRDELADAVQSLDGNIDGITSRRKELAAIATKIREYVNDGLIDDGEDTEQAEDVLSQWTEASKVGRGPGRPPANS